MNLLSKNNKNFIYVKKINKNKIIEIRKAFIKFISNEKKNNIKEALKKAKSLTYRTPNGMLLPKAGFEKSYLNLQNVFFEIIFNEKKIMKYIKENDVLIHFPMTIRIASDKNKRNYDSRIPHYDRWVGEPDGLSIISLNVYKEKDGACLQILDPSKTLTDSNKKLKRYSDQRKSKSKLKIIYTQKTGELAFMKDCYHRTYGGFGRRLNLEIRFIPYKNSINLKKNNNINKADRTFGYLPINIIRNINYKNLKFLNEINGLKSTRDYPVDFSLNFNI
jgi:hypothetical protein